MIGRVTGVDSDEVGEEKVLSDIKLPEGNGLLQLLGYELAAHTQPFSGKIKSDSADHGDNESARGSNVYDQGTTAVERRRDDGEGDEFLR